MDVTQFDFVLPQELIAQTPLADRAASRLLVMNKKNWGDYPPLFSRFTLVLK